jgi:hypothetical protein
MDELRDCPHCGKPTPEENLRCIYCGEMLPSKSGLIGSLRFGASRPLFIGITIILAFFFLWLFVGR